MTELVEDYSVRLRLERREDQLLALYASRSARSAGRERPEPESPVRTAFQRDRDRIIHSNAFRRLRGKTQVFIAPTGDHYATRLSHVLEVAQIARDIARALELNEDLAEAIALAHDLGHAPFGHAGQEALNALLGDGYRHDEQSVRVIQYLEKSGKGLNLSAEVVDGVRTHRKPRENLAGYVVGPSSTLEAEVVRLADAIAYVNHDIDDAVRSHLIKVEDLPLEVLARLGHSRSQRIDRVARDVIASSFGQSRVFMSDGTLHDLNRLREELFRTVYRNPRVLHESDRAVRLVTALFEYFVEHPGEMPPEFQDDPRREGVERRAADYIAGMTDSFASEVFSETFVPRVWPL